MDKYFEARFRRGETDVRLGIEPEMRVGVLLCEAPEQLVSGNIIPARVYQTILTGQGGVRQANSRRVAKRMSGKSLAAVTWT